MVWIVKLNTQRIKAERVALGITQQQLAENIDMSRASYAKRENGIVPFGADDIAKVADVLGLSNNIQIFFCSNRSQKATK